MKTVTKAKTATPKHAQIARPIGKGTPAKAKASKPLKRAAAGRMHKCK